MKDTKEVENKQVKPTETKEKPPVSIGNPGFSTPPPEKKG